MKKHERYGAGLDVIIRPAGSSQFLITQPDHAVLAAHIMLHWQAGGFPGSPRRSPILLAIQEHDNGWLEVDAEPIVDPATGRLLDFINAPDEVRREVWPRGIERLAATPYAAALVAQHALHIYRRYRADPAWSSFFDGIEALRERHLDAAAVSIEDLQQDYVFVRAGDLASLTFCNAWTDEQTDAEGYAMRMVGEQLIVAPDPFDGQQLPIEIVARELPDRTFASAADALSAFAEARTVTLTTIVTGPPTAG